MIVIIQCGVIVGWCCRMNFIRSSPGHHVAVSIVPFVIVLRQVFVLFCTCSTSRELQCIACTRSPHLQTTASQLMKSFWSWRLFQTLSTVHIVQSALCKVHCIKLHNVRYIVSMKVHEEMLMFLLEKSRRYHYWWAATDLSDASLLAEQHRSTCTQTQTQAEQ